MRPETSSITSACSSTIRPRAVLIRQAPSRRSANRRASSRPRVSSVKGRCRLTASAWASSSSSSRQPTSARVREWWSTRMSNAAARCATARPILPRPTIPSVEPLTSRPRKSGSAQPPRQRLSRTARSPTTSRRLTASNNAKASSAVAGVRTPGVFVSAMPRDAHASTSIES